ncbi:MAG: ATP-binding protein [Candidatus Saccharimonadales bacterium]
MRQLFQRIKEVRKKSLKNRLLLRVLAPPFLLLIALSVAGFWQLESMAHSAAADTLRRAAVTTATRLDREFTLRQTVLRNTGDTLSAAKSNYSTERTVLDKNREDCKVFLQKSNHFIDAPQDACRPFGLQLMASSQAGVSLQKTLEIDYANQVATLNSNEQAAIRKHLDAFVSYFPETTALIVVGRNGEVVSQANSRKNDTKITAEITQLALKSLSRPVEGYYISSSNQRQVAFAYPIESGAVIAAYNFDHANFFHASWQDTPIDKSKGYAVVANPTRDVSYPQIGKPEFYRAALKAAMSEDGDSATFSSKGVEYLSVAEPIGKSNWWVVVGSPSVIALDSIINAQIAAVVIIGLLIVSFLWVGTVFVTRTVRSIFILSSGAHTFSSGNLAHRINKNLMDDEEFINLASTLNNMAQRISEIEEATDKKNKEFISIATHEIKAPITAIIGNLSMILEDDAVRIDNTARELTNDAYEGTVRLRNLVDELLSAARIESNRTHFDITSIDIRQAILDMVALQQVTADSQGISIGIDIPSTLPRVLADRVKLDIILTNLISNAIKYNSVHGSVTINCEELEGALKIAVADTGLGIPSDQKSQMFQKFFRVTDKDRHGIPGTGLGLYITKQFIEGMNGQIQFESTHGKGTTFSFTLPIEQSE